MEFGVSNSSLMMEQSMRYLWSKQAAILDNISNLETPGYKAKYVTFEDALRTRLESASSTARPASSYRTALNQVKARVHETAGESMRMDGNSVNATVENLELSRTALQQQYVLTSITTDYSTLRAAIRG